MGKSPAGQIGQPWMTPRARSAACVLLRHGARQGGSRQADKQKGEAEQGEANTKARAGIGEGSRGSERGQSTCSLLAIKGFLDSYRERPGPDRGKPQPVDIGEDEDNPANAGMRDGISRLRGRSN